MGIYGSLILFPLAFCFANRCFGQYVSPTSAVCIYGYSFISFVIGGILCIIPNNTWRWYMLCLACGHSICFIFTNLKREIEKIQQDYKYITMASIAAVQAFLTLCFKIKFFYQRRAMDNLYDR